MEQSVPKRRHIILLTPTMKMEQIECSEASHIKFRRQGITQKKNTTIAMSIRGPKPGPSVTRTPVIISGNIPLLPDQIFDSHSPSQWISLVLCWVQQVAGGWRTLPVQWRQGSHFAAMTKLCFYVHKNCPSDPIRISCPGRKKVRSWNKPYRLTSLFF